MSQSPSSSFKEDANESNLVIASEFLALDQLAWIASSYFLTQAALLLLYGQVLSLFDGKIVYIIAISIFEVGKSLLSLQYRQIIHSKSRKESNEVYFLLTPLVDYLRIHHLCRCTERQRSHIRTGHRR